MEFIDDNKSISRVKKASISKRWERSINNELLAPWKALVPECFL